MAKHGIAMLPHDGVGGDLMDASTIVFETFEFEAGFACGDMKWELWRKDGHPLHDWKIELFYADDACLHDAIKSMPTEEADGALAPELKSEGFSYSNPIARLYLEL